jgi:hypothetical protein
MRAHLNLAANIRGCLECHRVGTSPHSEKSRPRSRCSRKSLPSAIIPAGKNLLTLSEVNVVNPLTGLRPYPNFGQVSWQGNKDSSSYQGLSVSAKRSFSRGLLFSGNYMWSHEIDDGSDGSGDGDSFRGSALSAGFGDQAEIFLV